MTPKQKEILEAVTEIKIMYDDECMAWKIEFTSAHHEWGNYENDKQIFQCNRCGARLLSPDGSVPGSTRIICDDPWNRQDKHVFTCDERILWMVMNT